MADPWATRPWRLLPNRVSRFYRGGLLLGRFRGQSDPVDSDRPEDWIGSATRAWTPPGDPPTDEGLSDADVAGSVRRIADVLAADPVGVAGADLAPTGTTGVLVKLLDAGIRLPVHAHPTRSFARAHLGSAFGKAEAWLVLGTRRIDGEPPPHVRLGFRRDVARDELRGWIEDRRTDDLLEALHDRPTSPGDVWFVPPGTPHAIGAGVFILEVQEPTDFSIVLETRGFPIAMADAHLGLGWDVMLDAIDRAGRSDAELATLRGSWTGADGPVLPPGAAPFFRVDRIAVGAAAAPTLPPVFTVGVVTAGRGIVRTETGELGVRAGEAFAVPAGGVAGLRLEPTEPLEVLVASGVGPR
ncbi:MAG TPA: class I mannose-6-phosphate isomerase [Candidatus Limnocylindrales bacterium]|nr:class I mannose-6-phosphate isomerase [Candidatus Limnocylindrales bacterium]